MFFSTPRNSVAIVLSCLGLVAVTAGQSQATEIITYSFQEGVSGYTGTRDTYVGGDNRSGGIEQVTPHGSVVTLTVYEREVSLNNFYRSLVGFDLTSVPPGTGISSATLTLWVSGRGGATPVANSLYAISSANGNWTEAQSTWNNKNQALLTPWAGSAGLSSPTTDYDIPAIAPTQDTPTVGSPMTFTLNAAGLAEVQSWINNPSSNSGFFIRQPDGSFSVDQFHSSEGATVAFHPLLTLTTFVPEPSTLALLGMGVVGLAVKTRRRRRTAC